MLGLNYVPGSQESIDFLSLLNEKAGGLSPIFKSTTITNFIEFKFGQVKKYAIALAILYFAYLICVTFFCEQWIMAIWLVIYSSIEIK